jgi:hypothetical protein
MARKLVELAGRLDLAAIGGAWPPLTVYQDEAPKDRHPGRPAARPPHHQSSTGQHRPALPWPALALKNSREFPEPLPIGCRYRLR